MKSYFAIAGLIFLILISVNALAMSASEAADFVTTTNSYLVIGEQAAILDPKTTYTYGENSYWVVVGLKDNSATIYIPINNATAKIADGDLEVRALIETSIVATRMTQLKNSFPVGDWPLSNTMITKFYDLQRALSGKAPILTSIQTTLEQANSTASNTLAQLAEDTQSKLTDLADESSAIASRIEKAKKTEETYLTAPNANDTQTYKTLYDTYFSDIETYSQHYNAIDSAFTSLKQGIAALPMELDSTEKDYMIQSLSLPDATASLPSLFSKTQETKTLVESIFSSSENVEQLVLELQRRELRNDAWLVMYAQESKLTALNASFTSLSKAAEIILSTDYVDGWKDQESVSALKTNWAQAQAKFNVGEFEKAKSFADKAEVNVEAIINGGVTEKSNELFTQEQLTQIIIALVAIFVVLILVDKLYLKRKKKGYEEDEDYEEK